MTQYTSIEQSKKLLELGLSPESADLSYSTVEDNGAYCESPNIWWNIYYSRKNRIPCWSVGALLELLPQSEDFVCNINFAVWEEELVPRKYELSIEYYPSEEGYDRFIKCDDSMVDLLYDGFVWLLKNGLQKNMPPSQAAYPIKTI